MNCFSSPIKKALITRQLWGGVPRMLFLINVIINIFIIMVFKFWYIVILGVLCHLIFRFFTDKDVDFLDVFIRYLKTKNYYYPS